MCARLGSASELKAGSQPSGSPFGVVVRSELFTCVFELKAYGNRSPLLARSTETRAACCPPPVLGAVIVARALAVIKTKPAATISFLKCANGTQMNLLRGANVAIARCGAQPNDRGIPAQPTRELVIKNRGLVRLQSISDSPVLCFLSVGD